MTEEARETRWSALRIELQEANDERDRAITLWEEASKSQLHLAAENARLRAAVIDLAGGKDLAAWHLGAYWIRAGRFLMSPIVPPHIVALQDAIYREEGE